MKTEGRPEDKSKWWGRHSCLPLSFVFSLFLFPFFPFTVCQAGTLRTLDGKTYEGQVTLEPSGQISVTSADSPKPLKFDLSNILQATFGGDAPKPAPVQLLKGQLPAPWQGINVGKPAEKPYAEYTNETFSIKSANGHLDGLADTFIFVAQPIAKDAELIAKFTTTANADQVGEGIMIRATREPDAAYASLLYRGGNVLFVKRARAGGITETTTASAQATLPVWMRLARKSDAITAYLSPDGSTWNQIPADATVAGPASLAGLAVCGAAKQPQGGHATNVTLKSITPGAIAPATTSLKEGLMLRSGTLLAGAQIEKADDGSITYNKAGRRDTISLVNVARIVFREIGPDTIAKIPEKRTGVLLREGDFIEGEFRSLNRGRIQLSSVLFGLANFDIRDKAVVLILGDIEPTRAEMLIRTRDGSIYVAKSVTPDKDLLLIEDAIGAKFSINRTEVVELSAGGSRMESLADIKPAKVEPPDGLSINSTGTGLPVTLNGAVCEKSVTLAAGASATWELAAKYRTLTFKCGVPQGVLATAPVRFIILADGKELFKSHPRTSLDDALTASISIKDAKSLTLKVESTAGQDITTPGLWGDVGLVK
jgi:hypothetical protein